jgi:hypothetical protein
MLSCAESAIQYVRQGLREFGGTGLEKLLAPGAMLEAYITALLDLVRVEPPSLEHFWLSATHEVQPLALGRTSWPACRVR